MRRDAHPFAWAAIHVSSHRGERGDTLTGGSRNVREHAWAASSRPSERFSLRGRLRQRSDGVALFVRTGAGSREPALLNDTRLQPEELLAMDFQSITHPDDLDPDLRRSPGSRR